MTTAGRRVGDRFVVEAPLGHGGMGSIHRGKDERLGEAVAIKFLRRALLDDPVLRERFRREALSLAKLRHPAIVSVLDFGEADGDLYMVLELVDGETLEEVLRRDGAMPLPRAAPLFDQLLDALAVCHASDVIHRDVKPSNVMLAGERLVLIDFGLAKVGGGAAATPKLTETGAVQGTPQTMAPEQCRGEEVVPATDVYGAGVLFYAMLAGTEPFHGTDAATFMAQHMFVDPPPLRSVAPHVSAGVAAAIHAALAKRPEDRPSARELRAALASAIAGTDPEALASAAADARRSAAGLPREERALTGRPPRVAARGEPARHGSVVAWMALDEHSAALRGAVGAAGIACILHPSGEPPDAPARGAGVVFVVSARDGLARVGRLRARDPDAAVVVVDVASPDETTACIRAGASDMLLAQAPLADLPPKIERLLRRMKRRP